MERDWWYRNYNESYPYLQLNSMRNTIETYVSQITIRRLANMRQKEAKKTNSTSNEYK